MDNKENIINELLLNAGKLPNDVERAKYVFDWFIKNVNYDYLTLENATYEGRKQKMEYIPEVGGCGHIITPYMWGELDINNMSREEKEILEEYIDVNNKYLATQKEKNERVIGCDIYNNKLGVCEHFASAYKEICERMNIPCEKLYGNIDSNYIINGVKLGHVWNIVKIGDQTRHIDISSSIHNRDEGKDPYEYFGLTTEQLLDKDKDRNRSIGKDQISVLNNFENSNTK